MFTGTYTAIVTPFKNGEIDETALDRLIQLPNQGGVDGIVPVGTTGESPTVDYDEHIRIIDAVGEICRRQNQGAGRHRRQFHQRSDLPDRRRAEKAGADGSLQVAPYYNKPTQEGLFQHFREIARSDATADRALQHSRPLRRRDRRGHGQAAGAANAKNIVGIKEAGGNADRVSASCARRSGPRFEILSGDDALTLPFMAVGAQGVISVASNVIPRQVAQMVKAFAARQRRSRAEAAPEVLSAVQGSVHRNQPDARQGRAGDDGPDRRGIPPAAGADEREEPRDAAGDHEGRAAF